MRIAVLLSPHLLVRFSVEFEEATKPCPFALRWHAAACVIPMMSAFVAFSLPPLLLWIFLLCGCFWMYGWLGLFASMQTLSALGLRGSEGEMQAQLMPQGLISPLLHLLALSPALYLLGPAWVLRCPPWLWHIPFPLNQVKLLFPSLLSLSACSATGRRDSLRLPGTPRSFSLATLRALLCRCSSDAVSRRSFRPGRFCSR